MKLVQLTSFIIHHLTLFLLNTIYFVAHLPIFSVISTFFTNMNFKIIFVYFTLFLITVISALPQPIELEVYNTKWAAIQDRFNFTKGIIRNDGNFTSVEKNLSIADEIAADRLQILCTSRFIDLIGTMCKQFLIQESIHYESRGESFAENSELENDSIPRIRHMHNVWNPAATTGVISNRRLKNKLTSVIPSIEVNTCCEAACNITTFIKYCEEGTVNILRQHNQQQQKKGPVKRLGTITIVNRKRHQQNKPLNENSPTQINNIRLWRNRLRIERQYRGRSTNPITTTNGNGTMAGTAAEDVNNSWNSDESNEWTRISSSSTTTPSTTTLTLHQSFLREFHLRPNQPEPEPVAFPMDMTDIRLGS